MMQSSCCTVANLEEDRSVDARYCSLAKLKRPGCWVVLLDGRIYIAAPQPITSHHLNEASGTHQSNELLFKKLHKLNERKKYFTAKIFTFFFDVSLVKF